MGFAIFPRTPQAIFPTHKLINGSKIRKNTSSFESIVNVIAYVVIVQKTPTSSFQFTLTARGQKFDSVFMCR